MLENIRLKLTEEINKNLGKGMVSPKDFVYAPSPEMGDLSLPCFDLAKKIGKAPNLIAEELKKEIKIGQEIKAVSAAGPYINFKLEIPKEILKEILKQKEKYGQNKTGKNKKIMVEFAHPNTHKSFHIGHLRNIITGESVARILSANGYKIIRANYQGDVGLHIAKCLWGIKKLQAEYEQAKKADVRGKAAFLGQAYVLGSKSYEENEEAKTEIVAINKKIYEKDKTVLAVYKETRKWSLEYFAQIYKRVNTKFDKFYFESEVFKRGKDIVLKNLEKGIFQKSDGAVIFAGEKYGLHNRVFINSEGNPTYEGKDMGLAELQLKEKTEKIIHVVGPEQAEYFKVIFKALEFVMPKSQGKEMHLAYGWVRLKDGKMSSRLGNVILGEWLLDEVKKEITKIVEKNERLKNKSEAAERITVGAVKFSILKNGLNKDIAFDINESISLSGNSGPYLQYTYARIKSILRKSKLKKDQQSQEMAEEMNKTESDKKEHGLMLALAKYPEAIEKAGSSYDPSQLAKYLFELSQSFNDYYHSVPVLASQEKVRKERLQLIEAVSQTIKNGLNILGIETLEEM